METRILNGEKWLLDHWDHPESEHANWLKNLHLYETLVDENPVYLKHEKADVHHKTEGPTVEAGIPSHKNQG